MSGRMTRMSPRLPLALALLVALVVPSVASAATRDLAVSLGDSYATGYQRFSEDEARNTRNGFVDQLPALARKRGYGKVKVVNFGCGGATTVSLIEQRSKCRGPAVGGRSWGGRSQLGAAERFLKRNRARIAYVTVSIGGNDVTACARAPEPVPCVADATKSIDANVTKIARRLRKAAGAKVPMVGITYPDVILGQWVTGQKADQDLAKLSVVAFKSIINPALKKAYAKSKVRFADVTAATGAYTPLEQTVETKAYGVLPVAVATICDISYYCRYRDIHLRTKGYGIVAREVAKKLPRKR
jgi:lysophospholipase L1-like esterase